MVLPVAKVPGDGGKRSRGRGAPAGHGHGHHHGAASGKGHIGGGSGCGGGGAVVVAASGAQIVHSHPPYHHVHPGQAAARPPQRVVAPKRQAPAVVVSSRPCSGEQRGTPATMALIAHQDGPPYPGEEGGGSGGGTGGHRPNRRRQGQATRVRGDHRQQERRRTRYLLLGATCMIPGLILYFGGGYLFVSAYNTRYPFVEISVDAALVR